jgi:hypothetical protein
MTLPRPLAEAALAEPSKVVNRPAIPRKRLVLRRGDMRAPGRGGQAADDVKGMQFCAYCGEELLPRARKCTFCGRAVAAVHEDAPARPRAPTYGTLIGGGVCLAMAVLLRLTPIGADWVYYPLIAAAAVLAIASMARRQAAGGAGLLLATIFLPVLLFFGGVKGAASRPTGGRQQPGGSASSATSAAFRIEDPEGFMDGDSMTFRARLRNRGTTPLRYVQVMVEWLDAAGAVIDSDWTMVVGGEGLPPGDGKPFEIVTTADTRMHTYRYRVVTR